MDKVARFEEGYHGELTHNGIDAIVIQGPSDLFVLCESMHSLLRMQGSSHILEPSCFFSLNVMGV